MKMNIDAMRANAHKASALLGAMANEKRLMILCQLAEGERSVTELAELIGTRQSTVSQHLALLRKDRFVKARRDAQTFYYSLDGEEARAVIDTLYSLYCAPQARKRKRATRAR